MAFLDYVNEICNEIYDVIVTNVNKLYQGAGTSSTSSPHREISIRPAQQWQNYQKKLQPTEKPLDDALKVNEQLCLEIASTQEEYKRLRGVIDQLSREYETSKDLDLFRRYGMLKGMIKRSVLHLKLSNEDKNHAQSAVAEQRQKEDLRKREEHLTGLTADEISSENIELQEQIKENRRKISMMKDLIEQMERQYEASKRYVVIQRYRLLKSIIKNAIHNKWI